MENIALAVSNYTYPSNTTYWYENNTTVAAPSAYERGQIFPVPNPADGDTMFIGPKDPEEWLKLTGMPLIKAKLIAKEEHERGRLIERPDEETE